VAQLAEHLTQAPAVQIPFFQLLPLRVADMVVALLHQPMNSWLIPEARAAAAAVLHRLTMRQRVAGQLVRVLLAEMVLRERSELVAAVAGHHKLDKLETEPTLEMVEMVLHPQLLALQ
jgi:hypothetical protein